MRKCEKCGAEIKPTEFDSFFVEINICDDCYKAERKAEREASDKYWDEEVKRRPEWYTGKPEVWPQ
jgi:ribosome-binding protein aMBF1 (putative translation factor)